MSAVLVVLAMADLGEGLGMEGTLIRKALCEISVVEVSRR